MATLKLDFSTHRFVRLVLIFGLLILALLICAACSGSGDSEDQVGAPQATASTESAAPQSGEPKAPVVPTATTVPPTLKNSDSQASESSTQEDPATPKVVPPADPSPTTEPETPEPTVSYFVTPESPDLLLAVNGELFVGGRGSGFVSRRNVPSGESLGSIRGGRDGVRGMVFDGENIWTSDFTGAVIKKISPDGEILGRFDMNSPGDITFDGTAIWVASKDNGTVTKLAMDGTKLGVFEAGPFPGNIAFDGTDIWMSNSQDETLTRLSLAGELLETVDLGIGRSPGDIVADENYLWVPSSVLIRIPIGGGPIREFELSGSLALDGESVYISHGQGEGFGSITKMSQDGVWQSTVIVGGDGGLPPVVIDGNVHVGITIGRQIAVVTPEVFLAGAPTLPDGVVETEVTVEGTEATVTGALARPAGDGPHPAVVMINGTGSSSRDMIFTFRWMRTIALHLADQGIATLRLDDRGIGFSTGDVMETTIESRVIDTLDAFEFLKSQEGIDPARVGLFGHSEGGAVVAAAAAEADIAFIVSIGGTVAPHRELLPLQTRLLLEATGSADSYIESALEDLAFARNAILTGENLEELRNLIELGSVIAINEGYRGVSPEEMLTPWYKSFIEYDPGIGWAGVEEPVLALFGAKDWVVPAEQNEPILRQIFADSGNTESHIQTVASANHFFQPAETGASGEIGTNPREFVPGFLNLISDWITEKIDAIPASVSLIDGLNRRSFPPALITSAKQLPPEGVTAAYTDWYSDIRFAWLGEELVADFCSDGTGVFVSDTTVGPPGVVVVSWTGQAFNWSAEIVPDGEWNEVNLVVNFDDSSFEDFAIAFDLPSEDGILLTPWGQEYGVYENPGCI